MFPINVSPDIYQEGFHTWLLQIRLKWFKFIKELLSRSLNCQLNPLYSNSNTGWRCDLDPPSYTNHLLTYLNCVFHLKKYFENPFETFQLKTSPEAISFSLSWIVFGYYERRKVWTVKKKHKSLSNLLFFHCGKTIFLLATPPNFHFEWRYHHISFSTAKQAEIILCYPLHTHTLHRRPSHISLSTVDDLLHSCIMWKENSIFPAL